MYSVLQEMILCNCSQPLQKMKKYIHLIYVTNQDSKKEKRGRLEGSEVSSVQLDPDEPLLVSPVVLVHMTAHRADCRLREDNALPRVGNICIMIQ